MLPATILNTLEDLMAVSVAIINMKGGVGKTTLATQIAWFAVVQKNLKVLLIDLDPQANASQSVMSPETWVEYLSHGGLTVANIFEQFTPTGSTNDSPKELDIAKVVYERIAYPDGSLLHLVPSRLELSWTLRNPNQKETLLARFVSKIESRYDLILVDCAPTDSILTDAAYHCSRFILVPIRAEFLATIGFPLLNRSIKAFQLRHEDKVIEVCGLVFNDFIRGGRKREHRLARVDVTQKAREFGWKILKCDVPHSDSYFRAARDGLPIQSTKSTRGFVKSEFSAFAEEFFREVGL